MGNLNKVQYTDHQTVITADNLNAIQDSVIQNTSYTTCSTAAGTAAKTVALTNFVLTTGSAVKVKFTNSNTAANPTLNVNSTGAKPIMQYGVTAVGTTPSESWNDGAVVEFVYDGTNWIISDAVSQNAIEIPVNADLDDYTIVGEYFCASSANTQTLSNCPVTASFNMIISKRSPNYVIQRIETGAALWTRTSSGSGWNGWHPFARADGDTFSGNITVDRANGTTSANGTSSIYLGNTTPTGTAGNSYGRVQIYGKGANYGVLLAQNVTADRELQFPDESGTLMTNQGGTFIKPVIIDEHNGTASSVGASHLTLGNSTASGTAGNSTASLVMYGRQSYYIGLYTAETLTSNRSVYLPDLGGTIYVTNRIDGSDGYASATSIAAVRNFCDSLPERTCTNAVLVAGDIGYLTVFKATSNYCTIVRTSYNGPSYNSPVVMHSMQKYGGNWGPWVQIMGGAGATASYTPTITAPQATGFSVDNVSFYYKITSDFLWINGRFRVVNHGTGNSNISISYPSGVTTIQEVGSFGTVHCNNSVNTSGLSLRPANDGKSMFIQSGAGNVIVNSIIPNGDYIVLQAMIPLR